MKTTEQWWAEVSSDEDKMIDWLKDQYRGEVTAETRIRALITDYALDGDKARIINKIADDERKHAEWVASLLFARGIPVVLLDKEERYWEKTLPKEKVSFEYMCAVGHHAETMRLERINLLSSDERFIDIARVFAAILPDEKFHARAFAYLSTPEAIEAARGKHKEGLEALGLVI